jgi:hypothetical protein
MGVYYSHYLIPQDNTVRPEPDRIIALIEAWIRKGFIIPANGETSKATARFLTTPSPEEVVAEELPAEPQRGFWGRLFAGRSSKLPSRAPRPDPWKPFSAPPTGESLSALAKRNTLIRWAGHPKAVYPMKTVTPDFPRDLENFPPYLMIELSDDFLNMDTAPYGGLEGDVRQVSPLCTCGHDLGYEGGDRCGWTTTCLIRRLCPSCGSAFRPQDQLAEIVDGATGKKTPQLGGLCHRFAIIIDFGKEMPLYATDSNGELVDSKAEVTDAFLDTCCTTLGIKLNEFGYYS